VKLALFLAGALLLCGLVRRWRRLPLPILGGYVLLVLGYFAVPLCTPALQVPTDIAYQWRPWSATLPAAITPRNALLSDVPLQMLPFHDLVRRRLLAGELPLWAGELGTGQPLLGNAQSAPFAPLHLLALPLPTLQALTVAVAWQVLLSLLLMHALLAALGAGRAGAAFGAVAFAFSVFATCWAYHPHGMAMAWIPGVLLAIVLLRRGEAGGLAGLVACGARPAALGPPRDGGERCPGRRPGGRCSASSCWPSPWPPASAWTSSGCGAGASPWEPRPSSCRSLSSSCRPRPTPGSRGGIC
jgi:hypothetical protein